MLQALRQNCATRLSSASGDCSLRRVRRSWKSLDEKAIIANKSDCSLLLWRPTATFRSHLCRELMAKLRDGLAVFARSTAMGSVGSVRCTKIFSASQNTTPAAQTSTTQKIFSWQEQIFLQQKLVGLVVKWQICCKLLVLLIRKAS